MACRWKDIQTNRQLSQNTTAPPLPPQPPPPSHPSPHTTAMSTGQRYKIAQTNWNARENIKIILIFFNFFFLKSGEIGVIKPLLSKHRWSSNSIMNSFCRIFPQFTLEKVVFMKFYSVYILWLEIWWNDSRM